MAIITMFIVDNLFVHFNIVVDETGFMAILVWACIWDITTLVKGWNK